MKRQFTQKVKSARASIAAVDTESRVEIANYSPVAEETKKPTSTENRKTTQSAAMIGLAISMGATSLFMPQQAQEVMANEIPNTEAAVTNIKPSKEVEVAKPVSSKPENQATTTPKAAQEAVEPAKEVVASEDRPVVTEHKVQPSQTIRQLSQIYNVETKSIITANNLEGTQTIPSKSVVRIGQTNNVVIHQIPTDSKQSQLTTQKQIPPLSNPVAVAEALTTKPKVKTDLSQLSQVHVTTNIANPISSNTSIPIKVVTANESSEVKAPAPTSTPLFNQVSQNIGSGTPIQVLRPTSAAESALPKSPSNGNQKVANVPNATQNSIPIPVIPASPSKIASPNSASNEVALNQIGSTENNTSNNLYTPNQNQIPEAVQYNQQLRIPKTTNQGQKAPLVLSNPTPITTQTNSNQSNPSLPNVATRVDSVRPSTDLNQTTNTGSNPYLQKLKVEIQRLRDRSNSESESNQVALGNPDPNPPKISGGISIPVIPSSAVQTTPNNQAQTAPNDPPTRIAVTNSGSQSIPIPVIPAGSQTTANPTPTTLTPSTAAVPVVSANPLPTTPAPTKAAVPVVPANPLPTNPAPTTATLRVVPPVLNPGITRNFSGGSIANRVPSTPVGAVAIPVIPVGQSNTAKLFPSNIPVVPNTNVPSRFSEQANSQPVIVDRVNPEYRPNNQNSDALVRELLRRNQNQRLAVAPNTPDTYNPSIRAPFGQQVSPQNPAIPGERVSFIWPTRGVVTSGYGWRWGRMHRGLDIAAPVGTPIHAAAPGVVIFAGWNSGGYGNLVEIRHNDGTMTRYAHNSRIIAQRGQYVEQGQLISEMGSTGFSTGPHLHFEVHPGGRGAVNPLAFLPSRR